MAQIRREGDIDFRSSEDQSSERMASDYRASSYFEPPLRESRKESMKERPIDSIMNEDSWTRKSQSDNDLHH